MSHPTNPDAVKVKRDGPRGWHWVAAFDPDKHELFDAPPKVEAPKRKAKK
jgi:hypothetical protein